MFQCSNCTVSVVIYAVAMLLEPIVLWAQTPQWDHTMCNPQILSLGALCDHIIYVCKIHTGITHRNIFSTRVVLNNFFSC